MPLSSRSGGFNIRALEEHKNPFFHAQNMKTTACLPSVFPLPSSLFGLITTRFIPFLYAFLARLVAALSIVTAKRKSRPRSYSLGRNPTVIRKVLTERKTALETRISIWARRGRIKMRGWSVTSCKDHYLTAGANSAPIRPKPGGPLLKRKKTGASEVSRRPTMPMPGPLFIKGWTLPTQQR
jgi:hypothetical protein